MFELGGFWGSLVGLVLAVLLLASLAIVAVAIHNWLARRSSKARGVLRCPGYSTLDQCRTCNYLQEMGQGYLCSRYGKRLGMDDEGDSKAPTGPRPQDL